MSIFSIGVSGLHTAQIALQTTSNNISNVYTPGYNRELTLLNEQRVGGGVTVSDVQRQFDYFIAAQLNSANSSHAALESYHRQVSQIDNLLADLDGGLAPLLNNFFGALQDLAGAPGDPAARQGVIGAADTLSAQIRSFDRYLEGIRDGIGVQIESEVTQINNTAAQIAKLNNEISIAQAKNGEAPNTLLNQRDHLVGELSKRLDVRMHVQGSSYTLTIANGQPLVAGNQAYSLEAMASKEDPSRLVVGYRDSAGNQVSLAESVFDAGSLGGLISFRRETLDSVQNQVGLIATSLALAFNDQHSQGFDLDGNAGTALFSLGSPRVFSHADNSGSAAVSATFDDHLALSGADYTLRVVDAATGEFEVKRLDGGPARSATLVGNELAFDGLVLTVDDPALLADGDRFQLQPTRQAAASFDNLIHDTALIAAAGSNTTGSGDNENALALQNLQNSTLVRGKATLSQAYASLVGDVGNRSSIVQVNLNAQKSLSEQIKLVQQSESGVNLDEEAANLIRYQRYYQANARVIDVGSTILDTLLNLR